MWTSLALNLIFADLLAIGLRDPRAASYDSTFDNFRWKSGFDVADIDEASKYAITYCHELYQPYRLLTNVFLANLAQLAISFLFLLSAIRALDQLSSMNMTDFKDDR
jgi:hypothetical protein